jgi:selenocysteine lyase/cysteine desulfurase
VVWKDLPERHEAGTPNLVGAVALAVACQRLAAYGMDKIASDEADLYQHARKRLSDISGLELYTVWDHTHPHIGVLTFNLEGYPHGKLATILSAEYGISVRAGSFCAHPLVQHLLQTADQGANLICESVPDVQERPQGAVRLSMGLATTHDEIDYVADALATIAARGPRWKYGVDAMTGEHRPEPETRVWPEIF